MTTDTENITILDGKVTLYRRPGSKSKWQYRFWVPEYGRHKRVSAKTASLPEAKDIAAKAYFKAQAMLESDLPVFSKTFEEVFVLALQDEKRKVARGELTQKRYDFFDRIAKLYYFPFFENTQVTSITTGMCKEFWNFREDFWKGTKEEVEAKRRKLGIKRVEPNPKGSTLHLEKRILDMVIDKGIELGYLSPLKKPVTTPPAKNEKERRPALTMEQWKKMRDFMRDVYRNEYGSGVNDAKRRVRTQLYYYALTMVGTGMRVMDARNLKWEHVLLLQDANGQVSTNFQVWGKKNKRDVVSDQKLFEKLMEWRHHALNGHSQDGDYVFCRPDGEQIGDLGEVFETMKANAEKLDEYSGISEDAYGEKVTIYSLRHTYATFQRMYLGTSFEDLAVNMGTSAKMLKDHYVHVKAPDIVERLNKSAPGTLGLQSTNTGNWQKAVNKAAFIQEQNSNLVRGVFGNGR